MFKSRKAKENSIARKATANLKLEAKSAQNKG